MLGDPTPAPTMEKRVPPADELELGDDDGHLAPLARFSLHDVPDRGKKVLGRRTMDVEGSQVSSRLIQSSASRRVSSGATETCRGPT